MIISPKTAINEGWITHPDVRTIDEWTDAKYLGPNAIDFTLDEVYALTDFNKFVISEDLKQTRGMGAKDTEIDQSTNTLVWNMEYGSMYDCMSSMYVNIPEGVACMLVIRSTLSRNGVYLTSGLYDQGYKGAVGFALHTPYGNTCIAPGTRVGQILFLESQTSGTMYAGGYNHEKGTHWNTSHNVTTTTENK